MLPPSTLTGTFSSILSDLLFRGKSNHDDEEHDRTLPRFVVWSDLKGTAERHVWNRWFAQRM
jgi:hypothetical protein